MSELIEWMKLNTQTFATSIGFSKSTIYNIVGPRGSKPSSEIISAILSKYPSIRPEWLINGNGRMLISRVQEENRILLGGGVNPNPIEPVGHSNSIVDTDRDHEDAIPFVPIAAEGSYLQGFADEEYIEHMPKFYLPFLGLGSGVYAFQVRGDSMSDRFNNGDVVFGQKVEKNDALRWGEVYVLLCNDGLVVKELRKGPDELHFTLRSYNEHFDPYDILKTEVRQLFRYQASISFNSSNPNRGGVVNFMRVLSEQMGQVQNSLSNLPQAK